MQPRDVTVFGEQDVAALTPEVQTARRNGEGIARGVATNDQSEPSYDPLGWTAKFLHSSHFGIADQRLKTHDFLPNAEDRAWLQQVGHTGCQLDVNAVETALIPHQNF